MPGYIQTSISENALNGDGTDFGEKAGWNNNELQIYTSDSENSGIVSDDGNSVFAINAVKNGDEYTSAKVTTRDLLSVRFGRIDVKAKLPKGQGIWPAIWMLGDNYRNEAEWPGCGEIDIMEIVGHEPAKLYSTLHYTNGINEYKTTQGVYELATGDFSEEYHIFSINWTPDLIVSSIDGIQYFSKSIDEDMKEYLRDLYLIMNVAVGGNWPGSPDASTIFPQRMKVDYIRVFQTI